MWKATLLFFFYSLEGTYIQQNSCFFSFLGFCLFACWSVSLFFVHSSGECIYSRICRFIVLIACLFVFLEGDVLLSFHFILFLFHSHIHLLFCSLLEEIYVQKYLSLFPFSFSIFFFFFFFFFLLVYCFLLVCLIGSGHFIYLFIIGENFYRTEFISFYSLFSPFFHHWGKYISSSFRCFSFFHSLEECISSIIYRFIFSFCFWRWRFLSFSFSFFFFYHRRKCISSSFHRFYFSISCLFLISFLFFR